MTDGICLDPGYQALLGHIEAAITQESTPSDPGEQHQAAEGREEDAMTDGFFNNVIGGANCHGCDSDVPPTGEAAGIQEREPAAIDLTNFAAWLDCKPPVSTLAGMIDLIGSDLYRRHWPTYGAECKRLAKNMRTTIKYHAEHKEKRP